MRVIPGNIRITECLYVLLVECAQHRQVVAAGLFSLPWGMRGCSARVLRDRDALAKRGVLTAYQLPFRPVPCIDVGITHVRDVSAARRGEYAVQHGDGPEQTHLHVLVG